VGRLQAEPRGLLRVSAPLSFAPLLGPLAATYLSRHPAVQVELSCSDRAVDLVEERFDVAIRVGPLADSTLVARSLGTMARVLVAAAGYCKREGTPRAPAELGDHACIVFGAALWRLHAGDKEVEVRVKPRLTVNDLEIARDAARAAVGIAWLPEFVCADDIRRGRLRHVLPDWSSAPAPLHAVLPSARHLSPKVTAFVELAQRRFRANR
jgi:DNA-binding transcriptional LysR family regulator